MERLSYKDKLILIITAILVLVLLICAVIFWDDFYRFFDIIIQGSGNVGKYVRDLGYIGVLLLGGSIFIIYLIPVLSSVVFQMTAGLAYGVLLGTVLVGISIGLGSQLVYLFYRNYKILSNPKRSAKLVKLQQQIADSGRSVPMVLFISYFIPGIPFVMVSTIGAVSGIKYWKYFLLTFFGPWLEIAFTVALGRALVAISPIATMILVVVLLTLIVLSFVFRDKIINTIFTPQKGGVERKVRARVYKPNALLYDTIKHFVSKINKKRHVNFVDCQQIAENKDPFVVLCNHVTRDDFMYVADACGKHRLNFVCGHYEMYNKKLRPLLHHLGAIPKYLFQTDVTATMEMIRLARSGANLAIFPEGILTTTGDSRAIPEVSGKFFKKLGLQIYVLNIRGGYRRKPKYRQSISNQSIEVQLVGHIDTTQLANMSTADIDTQLTDWIMHSESSWLASQIEQYSQSAVDGNTCDVAKGLHNILYQCPMCGQLYSTDSDDSSIFCTNCGARATMNSHMQLSGICSSSGTELTSIPMWWQWQSQQSQTLLEGGGQLITTNAQLYTLDEDKPRANWRVLVGSGQVSLNADGLYYQGDKEGHPYSWNVPIANMPSVSYGAGKYIECYYGKQYYYFLLDNGQSAAQWANIIEQYHRGGISYDSQFGTR